MAFTYDDPNNPNGQSNMAFFNQLAAQQYGNRVGPTQPYIPPPPEEEPRNAPRRQTPKPSNDDSGLWGVLGAAAAVGAGILAFKHFGSGLEKATDNIAGTVAKNHAEVKSKYVTPHDEPMEIKLDDDPPIIKPKPKPEPEPKSEPKPITKPEEPKPKPAEEPKKPQSTELRFEDMSAEEKYNHIRRTMGNFGHLDPEWLKHVSDSELFVIHGDNGFAVNSTKGQKGHDLAQSYEDALTKEIERRGYSFGSLKEGDVMNGKHMEVIGTRSDVDIPNYHVTDVLTRPIYDAEGNLIKKGNVFTSLKPEEIHTPPKPPIHPDAVPGASSPYTPKTTEELYERFNKEVDARIAEREGMPKLPDHINDMYKGFVKVREDGVHVYGNKEDGTGDIFVDTLPKLSDEFKNVVYSHSFDAYGMKGFEQSHVQIFDNMKRFFKNKDTVQISAAAEHENIGQMGVYVKGDVHANFWHDAETSMSPLGDGRRVAPFWSEEDLITDFETYSAVAKNTRFKNFNPEAHSDTHSESVLTGHTPTGLWFKEGSNLQEHHMMTLKAMADQHSIPITMIGKEGNSIYYSPKGVAQETVSASSPIELKAPYQPVNIYDHLPENKFDKMRGEYNENYIYRPMSAEDYEHFATTGEFKSGGHFSVAESEGNIAGFGRPEMAIKVAGPGGKVVAFDTRGASDFYKGGNGWMPYGLAGHGGYFRPGSVPTKAAGVLDVTQDMVDDVITKNAYKFDGTGLAHGTDGFGVVKGRGAGEMPQVGDTVTHVDGKNTKSYELMFYNKPDGSVFEIDKRHRGAFNGYRDGKQSGQPDWRWHPSAMVTEGDLAAAQERIAARNK